MNCGYACTFIFPHSTLYIQLIAKAGVGVSNHWDVDRLRNGGRVIDHLGHGDQAKVRLAEAV